MDQERDRVLLRRVEVDRLDDVAVDRVALRARERELLGLAEAGRGDLRVVDRRQLLDRAAGDRDRVDLGRPEERVPGEEDPVLPERLRAVDRAVAEARILALPVATSTAKSAFCPRWSAVA